VFVHAPVAVKERIAVLDIIRGFALFGVLLVNMVMVNHLMGEFGVGLDVLSQPARLAQGLERDVAWVVRVLFQGKFYTIFAFLFGLGFHLFLTRGQAQDENRRLFVRRLAVLFGIGVLHIIFVWWGDVLATYALIGFLLLLFRRTKLAAVRTWALALMLLSFAIVVAVMSMTVAMHAQGADTTATLAAAMEKYLSAARGVYTTGTYLELVQYRLQHEFLLVLFNTIAMLPRILGLFLFGLYVGRLEIFKHIETNLPRIRQAWRIGVGVGAVLSLGHVGLQLGWFDAYLGTFVSGIMAILLHELSTPFLSLFYVTSIVLLWQRGVLSGLFDGFAALGRMALTNYLVQCIALAWLFYGHGLGLMGISIVYIPLMTVGIYAAQIVFSRWWLGRYTQGPAEWVWRRLTYGSLGGSSEQPSAGA